MDVRYSRNPYRATSTVKAFAIAFGIFAPRAKAFFEEFSDPREKCRGQIPYFWVLFLGTSPFNVKQKLPYTTAVIAVP